MADVAQTPPSVAPKQPKAAVPQKNRTNSQHHFASRSFLGSMLFMPIEIEAKIRFDDFSALRQTLEQRGAKRLREVVEHNLIFDREDGVLRNRGCGLRLRTCRDPAGKVVSCMLTYKGPRQESGLKSRMELETRIGEPTAMRAMLEAMQFQLLLAFTKWRETWRLDGCLVEMDEILAIGRFVEVEGPSESAVHEMLAKLNLAEQPLVTETYVQMLVNKAREKKP